MTAPTRWTMLATATLVGAAVMLGTAPIGGRGADPAASAGARAAAIRLLVQAGTPGAEVRIDDDDGEIACGHLRRPDGSKGPYAFNGSVVFDAERYAEIRASPMHMLRQAADRVARCFGTPTAIPAATETAGRAVSG